MPVAFTDKGVPKAVALTTGGGGVALTGLANVEAIELYGSTPSSSAIVWIGSGATDGGTPGADDLPVAVSALPVAVNVRGRGLAPKLYVTGADASVVVVLR